MGRQELRRAFQSAWRKTKFGELIPATLGRLNDEGIYDVEIEGKTSVWNWITLRDGTPHEAINLSVERSPGLHILITRTESGVYQVEQVDATRADTAAEGQAPPFNVPPHTHELGLGLDDPVSPRRIKVGLVTVGTGLVVNIGPFLYEYQGEWFAVGDSTIDLTAFLPGTAGTHAWCLIYYDPVTQSVNAALGDEFSIVIPLNLADLVDIALPDDALPLAGIALSEGMTTINEERLFVDARLWIGRANTTIQADFLLRAATILTLSGGAVTVTRGHHIIAAESGTADELETLTGLTAGEFYLLRADAGDTITVKHGVDNIELNGETDFDLVGMKSLLLFSPDGVTAVDVGIGGGGGLTSPIPLADGGTHADLSATGPGILQQRTSGADVSILLFNFTASVAPTTNDDSGDGYAGGSWWFDLTNDKAYVCIDATVGAAIWLLLVQTLTDLTDVSAAAQTNHFILAAGDGSAGGDYRGRLLVAADIPDLSAAYATAGHSHSAPDASVVTYTPLDNTDWDSSADPGDVDDALDQLADRVKILEGGTGTVTSVAFTASPSGIFDVSGSPVTTSGTLALSMDNQNPNIVLAGPSSGSAAAPSFRALVPADVRQYMTRIYAHRSFR